MYRRIGIGLSLFGWLLACSSLVEAQTTTLRKPVFTYFERRTINEGFRESFKSWTKGGVTTGATVQRWSLLPTDPIDPLNPYPASNQKFLTEPADWGDYTGGDPANRDPLEVPGKYNGFCLKLKGACMQRFAILGSQWKIEKSTVAVQCEKAFDPRQDWQHGLGRIWRCLL